MNAQDFCSLQEAYNQVYQEGWKFPNLQRITSRLGSLEQQIPNNRRDSPEYSRYRRVADVASSARNNPNTPFTRPAGDDYLNSVWNKFSSIIKPQPQPKPAVKTNSSNTQPTSQRSSLPPTRFRSGVGGGRFGGGRGEMLDKFGDYTKDLRNRGVTDYKPGGRYGIGGVGLADQYDLYDIILSHLLDEGYAETPEAAEAIMVNMSEEWRQSILG